MLSCSNSLPIASFILSQSMTVSETPRPSSLLDASYSTCVIPQPWCHVLAATFSSIAKRGRTWLQREQTLNNVAKMW